MPDANLFQKRDVIRERMAQDKALLKEVNDQIEGRYLDAAKAQLHIEGKDFGTTTIVENDKSVKVQVKKRVEWDQEALERISHSMRTDLVDHYVKKTLTIEERKYTTAPPDLQRLFQEARTAKIGGAIIEVVEE
jgi:hypothetical protein